MLQSQHCITATENRQNPQDSMVYYWFICTIWVLIMPCSTDQILSKDHIIAILQIRLKCCQMKDYNKIIDNTYISTYFLFLEWMGAEKCFGPMKKRLKKKDVDVWSSFVKCIRPRAFQHTLVETFIHTAFYQGLNTFWNRFPCECFLEHYPLKLFLYS